MNKYAVKLVMFAAAMACAAAVHAAKPKVIAHRGYWKAEGSAQNSIASLRAAARIGAWGSEFDVNVTSDGVAVVNHDEMLETAASQKKTDADFVAMKRIEDTPYAEFAEFRLSNGEKLPTLAEYLAEGVKYPKMKLILEIKSARSPEHETRSVDVILAEVEKVGAGKQVEYIAFSRHIVETLIARNPKLKVYYLNGDIAPAELKKMGCAGLDYSVKAMRKNPDWFAGARRGGLKTNVWTVNSDDDIRFVIDQGADFITTDVPETVMKEVSGK